MRRVGAGREAGFTLVELVVTLAILGLAMTMVYSLLLQGTNLWQRGDDQVEVQQSARIGINWVLREVRATAGIQAGSDADDLYLNVGGSAIRYYLSPAGDLYRKVGAASPQPVASGFNYLHFAYDPDPPDPAASTLVTVTLRGATPDGRQFELQSKARVRVPQ